MHQKRTKKLFLLTTWRMALTTKRAIILFLSERHLSRKERHLYFLPCQMHQKRTKNCSFWLHEEWLSPQKEQFFFLSERHLSRKERHLYFLPCQMHQKRTKKNPFDYMKNGSLHKKTIFLFLSEHHLSRKERNLYFLPCQMHQKRTKKLFLLTTWRMALSTKRAIFLFLSYCRLARKERHLYFFALPNASEKDNKLFLLTTWRMALSTKRAIFCSFLNVIFLEKNVICTFCLAKCIRKGKKIVPFDYMKNGSLHKKSNFFVPFLTLNMPKSQICTT